ncbi:MAG: vitamin K epoxide reductase family protein [Acidobacteriota bacterium]
MAGLTPAPTGAPPSLLWMWVAALLGLGASSTSAVVHHRLLNDPSYASFCDVNATLSCTSAYSSAYGSVAGVPVAVVGVVFFALVLLILALTTGSSASRAHGASYVLVMALAALVPIGYLGYASLVVLGTVCLLCVATYVAVVGLLVSAVTATRVSMSALPERLAADVRRLLHTPIAVMSVVAFLVAAGGLIWSFPAATLSAAGDSEQGAAPTGTAAITPAQLQDLEKFMNAQQRVPVMVASEGAAVVLVKFNDYMCPPCGQTFAEYKPVLARYAKEYPGKLKFVSRDYPLDPECNRLAPGGSHMASCEAAVAVRLAREKGKADVMENWLFSNQPTLTPASVKDAARTLAGVTDFDARYATTLALVKGDIEQGGQLQVQGTPTFFMNGIRLPGLRAAFLDAAIALEMKRAGVTVR